MSTPAQIAANRANAQKSTGPRTAEGKSRSRLNAIDHNLTGTLCLRTDAEQAAFDDYFDRLLPDLAPADEFQFELASRIISTMFRLAQIPILEANIYAAANIYRDAPIPETPQDAACDHAEGKALTFIKEAKAFNNLSLYEQRLNRGMHKDLDALRKLQREAAKQPQAAAAKPAAKPAVHNATIPTTSGEIGFVFATPPAQPASPPEAVENAPENMAA